MSFYNPATGAQNHHNQQSFGQPSSPYQQPQQQHYNNQQQPQQQQQQQQPPQQQQQQFQQQQYNNQQPNNNNNNSMLNAAYMAANIYSSAQNGGSDAMFDAGLQASKLALNTGISRFLPGATTFYDSLKYYFNVDNNYVKAKLSTLLFPFLKKNWMRLKDESNTQSTGFVSPRGDENAPDLYIPLMSLCSYVLLSGLLFGTSGKFTPEIIKDILVYCMLTQCLEVFAIKLGYFLLQAPSNWLDLFSFTGYKYVGLCINMIVGLMLGYWFYNICLLWTASCVGYFMMKTFANNIPRMTSSAGPKREFMVLGFAAAQMITMWWLGNTAQLKKN